MRFRKWLFIVLALLALGWMVLGLSATSSAFQTGVARNAALEGVQQDAANTGTTIGAGLTSTFTLCTGLPLLLLFSFLAWRNAVGIREKKRHEELLQATRHE